MRTTRLPYIVPICFTAWLLCMISIPIVRWLAGDAILPLAVTISVMLQTAATLAALLTAWRVARTAVVCALILLAAWAIELVGSRTGYPFGIYHYTDRLTPQLGGVPLLIPLAWLMMLPAAWAVAQRISGRSRGAAFIGMSGLSFMAWDLFLDPQMVGWGFWQWAQQPMLWGGYFGIPWLNFVGWAFSAALLTQLVLQFVSLDGLPHGWLMAMYVATWLLESVGQALFWQLPGPALVGFLAMGVWVVWGLFFPHNQRGLNWAADFAPFKKRYRKLKTEL
ncbi:MAG: carotenoid biosynthesis protein [Caldilineaceae bacterium]|nr:carotenoid biosynthesis protein [Caldilineaceae bacterium]